MLLALIKLKIIGILTFIFVIQIKAQTQPLSVIPRPKELIESQGCFVLDEDTYLKYERSNREVERIAVYFHNYLVHYYDLYLTSSPNSKKVIRLKIDNSIQLGTEGYQMKVSRGEILITASSTNGLFYGIQTLKQLMPAQSSDKLNIPYLEIEDQPRFAWRGLMLDVSRHFFPVFYLKELLDYMALYKLNTFHWHLTDDQGWRIEIKKYPKLTDFASWRNETIEGNAKVSKTYDGIGYGGFYTQDQIRDIVQYATERFITVIPEIEMPGHSSAALAAYPELGCTGGPYNVQKTWGRMKDVYCPGKEETFLFLQNVITEICNLFPSPYIHIGGDECPKITWKECTNCQKRIKDEKLKDEDELQSYFIRRMEKYLISKNKKLIGWDEILEGGLSPEATVMSWRGIEGGIKAIKLGHDVVMTPTAYCYFDYYQSRNKTVEHPSYQQFLPLEKVYSYDPIPDKLNDEESKHILGTQANVWTEYITNIDQLEYMVFPRICALSEIAWSAKELRDFTNFRKRMETEYLRMKMLHINYCDHSF
ncbi:MAG: beta-N-acetylhexosaminidase [Prolixibacteraceae bacterium]|jgi:hexosaminidase|nr:beta-N-acetylhexosaminidase [Prolixibacteraceae bacterium]